MATNTYQCTVCKRNVERIDNIYGLDILSKCVITSGCRGKLRKTGRNLDNIRESFPKIEADLADYVPRNAFFQHQQDIPSDAWIVVHDLNTTPTALVFLKDANGKWQSLPKSEFTIAPVNSNTTKLTFKSPQSGIVQFIARSSTSSSAQLIPTIDALTQVTVGGTFVFALPKIVFKNGVPVDLKNPLGPIKIEVVLEKPSQEAVWCFETLYNTAETTPWTGVEEILVAKRRNYYLKTKNILDFSTFNNPDLQFSDIPEGTRLRFVAADYGTGVTVPLESKSVLMLLGAAPYELSDKVRNKFLDLGELNAVGGFLTYSNGEFYVDTSAVENTYPPIEIARKNGSISTPPPTASLTPTPTPTQSLGATPTPTPTHSVPPTPAPSSNQPTQLRNIPYGTPDPERKLDIYLPANPVNAPVIFMVHGGGWHTGDKSMSNVVTNKIAYWLPKGFIFVSINYRLNDVVDVTPLEQMQDVADAYELIKNSINSYGGDNQNIVLMGHSAGCHLVSLFHVTHPDSGARGCVMLDSAVLNVPQIMALPHPSIYDNAFGTDEELWDAASPALQLTGDESPMILVARRLQQEGTPTEDLHQANQFIARATFLGSTATLIESDLEHEEINSQLGLPSAYTEEINSFIMSVLTNPPPPSLTPTPTSSLTPTPTPTPTPSPSHA